MFHKKGALKRFGKFTGKHLRLILFFVKLQALSYAALLKKRLRDRCFAVNFPNFLSTFFLKRTPPVVAFGRCEKLSKGSSLFVFLRFQSQKFH